MPLSTRIIVFLLALAVSSSPMPSYAQSKSKASAPSIPQDLAAVAASPAMRVYDSATTDCFKEVMNIDPMQAGQMEDVQALNMDGNKFIRIQDCMNRKGIPVNFENYYTDNSKEGLSAAQRADLQVIQDVLDSGKAATAPAAPPVIPSTTVMPSPQAVPLPSTAPAAPNPGEETADTDSKSGGSSTKAPRPSRQYWVSPE